MTPMYKRVSAALGALALVASASHANAADVYEGGSIKDEPVYSTPYIGWTGFYVGGNIGAAFDVTDAENVFGDEAVFTGGGHLGYNWQLSDRFLVGLEGDLGFVDDDDTEYLGTIRARLGLTRGPMLAYVTGGAAFIEFDDVDTDTGYVVGAGLEYKLQDNWSIGGEGLYYGFENPNDADDDDLEFWTARARLTYHFGGGGREWLK